MSDFLQFDNAPTLQTRTDDAYLVESSMHYGHSEIILT
jgi:hypothetical protein